MCPRIAHEVANISPTTCTRTMWATGGAATEPERACRKITLPRITTSLCCQNFARRPYLAHSGRPLLARLIPWCHLRLHLPQAGAHPCNSCLMQKHISKVSSLSGKEERGHASIGGSKHHSSSQRGRNNMYCDYTVVVPAPCQQGQSVASVCWSPLLICPALFL